MENVRSAFNATLINCECIGNFFSLEYKVTIDSLGIGEVVFDTSQYSLFTIAIEKFSKRQIQVQVEVSPNGYNYRKDSPEFTIKEDERLETYIVRYFLKYTCVKVIGEPGDHIYVYLQGKF